MNREFGFSVTRHITHDIHFHSHQVFRNSLVRNKAGNEDTPARVLFIITWNYGAMIMRLSSCVF